MQGVLFAFYSEKLYFKIEIASRFYRILTFLKRTCQMATVILTQSVFREG